MLRQEADQPSQTLSGQSPSRSSGAPRVTPEELNVALAAIEARRQAEAKTIPIDQAVSELHLDSTSDEIWAEVKAQRTAAAAGRKKRKQQRLAEEAQKAALPRPRKRLGFTGLALIALSIVGFMRLDHLNTLPHSGGQAAPILHPLAQEPESVILYADDAALIQLSKGVPASKVFVSENAAGNQWQLIKLDGHVYLQGYIARTDALQSLQGKAFNVYNDSDSGDLHRVPTSDIRLRVDKTPLLKSGGDSDYSKVTIPNFQPDPLTTLSDGR